MTPIIRARGLTKRFGEFAAVDHLDLEVLPGQVFAFLGANGSGKSTTIRMLIGLLRPTAGEVASVRAVVTIGTPGNPGHLGGKLSRARDEAGVKGETTVTIGGRAFSLRREFFEQLEATRMDDVVSRLEKALLVLHSPVDDVVGIENAAVIFRLASHPKSLVSLGRADHLLLKPEDAVYAGEVIAAWAGYYL